MIEKNLQNSGENACVGVSVLQLYLKRDSDTDIFLWVLRNVEERVFYRTRTVAASETFILDVWLRSEYFPEDRFFFL